ncbi:HNH endonuclease [Natribacillus halophilus]|uniref:HNH endonuclease n=1 Tax=Natribacillus halophilus TaxID=549003 RepID=A0A1G8RUI6_9BACI|nr:HNH endonuclease [Natribacillus halophilus]SDJ20125.1 HNH endonuclease [Natribacillus halophilus]
MEVFYTNGGAKRYKDYIDKPFHDLSVKEFREMRRNNKSAISAQDMIEHYGVTPNDYVEFVQNTEGIALASEEKKYHKSRNALETSIPKKKEKFKGIELKAFRLLRGYSQKEMARKLNLPVDSIRNTESEKRYSNYGKEYMKTLKIKDSEKERVRSYLNGKSKGLELDREIPSMIKAEVRKRDGNKCSNCGRKGKLHFHHRTHFSKGGLHTAENLTLLCVPCHAKEHEDELVHGLISSMK